MYLITAPFIIVGLVAKLLNRKAQTQTTPAAVHSNQEPQLYNLIEVVAKNIGTETFGSLYQDEFFTEILKTPAYSRQS